MFRFSVALFLTTTIPVEANAQTATDRTAGWSIEEYQRLSAELDAVQSERQAAEEDSEQWRAATDRALDLTVQLAARIDGWLIEGSIPAEFSSAADDARVVLLGNAAVLASRIGECRVAKSAANKLGDIASSRAVVESSRREAERIADECLAVQAAEAANGVSNAGEPAVADQETEPIVPIAPHSAPKPLVRRNIGIALASVGGAAVVGGLAYDLSMRGKMSEFDELNSECAQTGDCDTERRTKLAEQVKSARAPVGVLYGVGAALAITGVTLSLLPQRKDAKATVSVSPGWSSLYLHATF